MSDLTSSLVLTAIRDGLVGEIMAVPAAPTITMRRGHVVLIASAIAETIDRVEALELSAAQADVYARELGIAKAEIARLELRADVVAYAKRGGPLPGGGGGATVIDLSEAWARKQRGGDQTAPGGAA